MTTVLALVPPLLLFLAAAASATPFARPFASDGCTFWPDDGWRACCVQHDYAYWRGGSYRDRLLADLELAHCVGTLGPALVPVGWLMFAGSQVGGASHWPTPFRWGWGHRWPRSRGRPR